MVALASVADVEDRLGRSISDPDERLRIEKLLDDASAAVRAYCGQVWLVGSTSATIRPRGNYVRIPPGATAVSSVVNPVGGAAVPYRWDGLDRVYLWPAVYQEAFDWEFTGVPNTVTVAYTLNDTPPDAVVGVVCQMAARAFGVKPEDSGHQQESIASYSYTVGTAAASGAVGMLQGERDVLDAFRRVGASAWVGTL